MNRLGSSVRVGTIAVLAAFSAAASGQSWSGMKYREVGPWRGGRVTAVTGVPSQPLIYYMGTVGGGVWKTVDAGHTWLPIDYARGLVRVGVQSATARPDTEALLKKLMEEHGIPVPPPTNASICITDVCKGPAR